MLFSVLYLYPWYLDKPITLGLFRVTITSLVLCVMLLHRRPKSALLWPSSLAAIAEHVLEPEKRKPLL